MTSLNSAKGDDFQVSDINELIFDQNLAEDALKGKTTNNKEGAG